MFSLTRDEFDILAPLLSQPRAARRPADRRKRGRAHGAAQRVDPRHLGLYPDLRAIVCRSRRVAGHWPFN